MFKQWAIICAGFVGTAVLATAAEPKRPNVILIMSDDMGFSDLGCYGGEIQTPNLDALSAGGLRFTQFYNGARCCPTRASLLTGLYPHQAGIGHMVNDRNKPGYRGSLNENCRTIAQVLKSAGYRNYAVGKWHVTANVSADGPKHNWPLQRGFDRFYGMVSGGGSFYDPYTLCRDNRLISPFADPEYKPKRYYFTEALSDHAVKFLGDHVHDHADRPFFMYLTYTAAHWPMHALPEDMAKYRGKYDGGYEPIRKARFDKAVKLGLVDGSQGMSPGAKKWDDVSDKARESACMETYAAMVDRMDQGIGRITAELKRLGRYENTLIFFLQDNGGCAEAMGRGVVKGRDDGPRKDKPTLKPIPVETLPSALVPLQTRDGYPVRQGPSVMPGPYDTYIGYGEGWANVSNTPFREYKHWVHEGGISTPLIAHWPQGISVRNELRKVPGHLIDIAATIYDLAEAKYPADATPLEGRSLKPVFGGGGIEREALYWEHEGNKAVRRGDLKIVAKHNRGWELYDISKDRTESRNLASSRPKDVEQMAALWDRWAKRSHVEPWAELEPAKKKAGKE